MNISDKNRYLIFQLLKSVFICRRVWKIVRITVSVMMVVVVVVVVCCVLLATSGAAATVGGDEGARSQPHIVVILADDLGWNDVPWNNQAVQAPHMEALAREGVILDQSYVQPVCTPTRSALLTGRYPFTIGTQHGVIRPAQPSGLNLSLTLMPETLKGLGYSTHAVGKWHLGFCSWPYTPTKRGFDTFYGYYTGAEDYYTHMRDWILTGDEENSNNTTTSAECNDLNCYIHTSARTPYLDLRNNTTPDRDERHVYSTDLFASRVEELLTARDQQVPMFLYLALQSVHSPLQVPKKYQIPYAYVQDHHRRIKLGMVSAMDEAIGRVVTALKNTDHYNNTIIIFSSDNGGPTVTAGNNWPLRGNKSTLWEGGTRGAAFVHSPLLPNTGTSNPTMIHVTDWFPTLVRKAGGAAPEGIDGVDQWGAITGEAPPARSQLVYNIDNTTQFSAGIRMGKYKLLVGYPGPGEWTPPPENITATHQEGYPRPQPSPSSSSSSSSSSSTPLDEDETVSSVLQEMTGRNDTKLRLYDLNSDPLEVHNVAATQTQVVRIMLHLLKQYMSRYTPADVPHEVMDANPKKFGQVWSPGWC